MKTKLLSNIASVFISAILTALTGIGYAQKQANMWYFGDHSGLDFNSGSPVVLTNSAMYQYEGCSSISDGNGNLLFYTNGQSVWNKFHGLMPNGTGLNGDVSSTQSALIVQQPASTNLYFIFTTDAGLGPNGFCYSIVDMTIIGGLGDVTIKNTLVYTPSTEKLAAVNDTNNGLWILTHQWNNNNFNAYHLTSAGFDTVPVVSSSGPIITSSFAGYLKFSSRGDKVATALSNLNLFCLFNFDNATGIVSNPISLSTLGPITNRPYGIEFSPNENILYGSTEQNLKLYQWDISSGNAATINASCIDLNVLPVGATYGGALSIAPNNKIYFSRAISDYLGVINDPNVVGIGCNFADSGIFLMGKHCNFGLPNFNQSLFRSSFTFDNLCFSDSTQFAIPNSTGLLSTLWDFDDTVSGINNFSTAFTPTHIFSATGIYNVQLIKYSLSDTDTVVIPVTINAIPIVNLGNDTVICSGTTLQLLADTGYTSYLWQDGSTASIFIVDTGGVYSVVVNAMGCIGTDSIAVSLMLCNTPIINFASSDSVHCEKTCIDFTDLSTNNPTSWQWFFPGADSLISALQFPTNICYNTYGSYDVKLIACNTYGCDSLTLTNFISIYQSPPAPTIIQNNDTLICTTPAASYQWYLNAGAIAGGTSSSYVPTLQGLYYVIIIDSNQCDAASNSILITAVDFTNFNSLFQIAPNPNDGNFQVEFISNSKILNLKTQIINVLGEIVFEKDFENVNGKFSQQINLSVEAKGIYVLKVMSDEKIFTQKIIVK